MPIDESVKFELLFIGNELLIGKVLNTNSQWLSHYITLLGGVCTRITVVRDDLLEISSVVKEIVDRSPRFLIISGGLGPTYDDMTLEGLSKALNKPLRIDETALSWVTQKYQELHRKKRLSNGEMKPSRVKMATLPLTSKPLSNPVGTAPGVLIQKGSTKIICLPGVPKELKAIFERSVKNEILHAIGDRYFVESSFTVTGIGESAMADAIKEVMDRYSPYVYIKSHPKLRPEITVEFHLTTTSDLECYRKDREFLKKKIDEAQKELENKIEKLGGEIIHHIPHNP